MSVAILSRRRRRDAGGVTLVSDSFNRANSAVTMGSAETGQPWIVYGGTWGIDGSQAYCAAGFGAQTATVVDAGEADADVAVTLAVLAGTRVAFRFSDADNGWTVRYAGVAYELHKREAATDSGVTTGSATPAAGDRITVVLRGASIVVLVNGVSDIVSNSVFNQAATEHGLGSASSAGRFENFSVSTL